MSVHYKFKSTLNFDTITFDGLHISVADLKREIILQKRLGKIIDFDLQITNAQTKEEYKDDNFLIPKNTTLIVARIPVAHPVKKGWEPPPDTAITNVSASKPDNLNMDLFKMQGSEEEKIQAMMMQSTADYDPKTYHRIKGQSQVGEVPASYRCNKCKRGGHWIKNCTFASGKDQYEMKRNTGIPRSFRGKQDMQPEPEAPPFVAADEKEQEIPEDLICGICRNIFVDAVMIPCCGSSFCDECVRNSLLESEDSECPDCKEKNCSPGSLIPNRFLRNSVNVYKNETGNKLATFKPANKAAAPSEKKEAPREAENSNSTEKAEPANTAPANNLPEGNATKPAESSNAESTKKEKEKSDSDYEDNITIKMPQKEPETKVVPSEPSTEKIKTSYSQKSIGNNAIQRHDGNYKPEPEIKPFPYVKNENIKPPNERSLLPTPIANHPKYPNMNMNEQPRDKPMGLADHSSHRMGHYKPPYLQMPRGPSLMHMPIYNNGYNNMGHRPPMNFGHYPNQPVHQMNPAYMPPGNMNVNPTQPFPSSNLASIYQGVAAKVGTGLIDDPLEAFNRIMKEKEKLKVERRRSPGHHRSRSPGRVRHRFKSPVYDRGSSREMSTNEKRGRSRERKREYSYERRQSRVGRHSSNGSNSPSDKKKRYTHRRSPTPPKPGYRPRTREKSVHKLQYEPPRSKPDTIEPPPPGFESEQIESLAEASQPNISNRTDNADSDSRRAAEQNVSLKRQRHRGDTRTGENRSRSRTPPAKTKAPRLANRSEYAGENPEILPKTPERKEQNGTRNEKRPSSQVHSPEIHSKEVDQMEAKGDMGKENAISQLKDRKKKKKDKSEKKKNKKDKRDKKDKSKKSRSKSNEPPSEKCSSENLNMDVGEESSESYANNHTQKLASGAEQNALSLDMAEQMDLKAIEGNDIQVSKWELDDNNLNLETCKKVVGPSKSQPAQEHSEITSDIIRKAENAIFAKAINAIRPVEFKVVLDGKHDDSKDERSVSSKSNQQKERSHSPKSVNKSVKERLGNKVTSERNHSSDRSKTSRRESSTKDRPPNEDRHKHGSASYSSRKRERERDSKERTSDKKHDEHKSRDRSHERDFVNTTHKDIQHKDSNNRQRGPSAKDRPPAPKDSNKSSTKDSERDRVRDRDRDRERERERERERSNRNKHSDSDRSAHHKSPKIGEIRLISSIASRPCRPDNPFRKFDENISSSNKVKKFDSHSLSKGDITPTKSDQQAEYKKRKDKKLKKVKTLKKCSSSESLHSDKQKDAKSKDKAKKNKILKKKKKSRK